MSESTSVSSSDEDIDHYEEFNDPDDTRSDVQRGLERCLDNVKSAGSFASYGSYATFPLPGLEVTGLGTVGLPLSDRDAEALAQKCHKSPFGKGSDTCVDESVRKTLELDRTEFGLTNPEWQTFLSSLVTRVVKDLGTAMPGGARVSAHRYKLLLYRKGAMFKPHKDTEKEPGMFATLVISLPTVHDGGELRVTHGKETRVYSSSKSSEHGLSFMAWYADVLHEVKPVQSGQRLVLTYNLVLKSALGTVEPPTAASLNADNTRLQAVLSKWIAVKTPSPRKLIYQLEHQYTDASLSYASLKGADATKARALMHAAQVSLVDVYLANIERTVQGDEDNEDFRDEMSKSMRHVVDLHGKVIGRGFTMAENEFVKLDPYENRDADESEHEGYTGNEGAPITYFYRDTALVIVPKALSIAFMLEPELSHPHRWHETLIRLLEEFREHPENGQRREKLSQACIVIFDRRRLEYISDSTSEALFECFIALDDISRAMRSLDVLRDLVPPNVLCAIIQHLDSNLLPEFRTCLEKSLASCRTLSAKQLFFMRVGDTIERCSNKHKGDILAKFREWERDSLIQAFASLPRFSREDAGVVFNMAKSYGATFLERRILPTLLSNPGKSTAFMIPFVRHLFVASSEKSIPDIEPIAKSLLESAIAMLDIKSSVSWSNKVGPDRWESLEWFGGLSDSAMFKEIITPDNMALDLATLYGECLGHNQQSSAASLLDHIQMQSVKLEAMQSHAFIVPLLRHLVSVLQTRDIPLSAPQVQKFYTAMLKMYLSIFVGHQPPQVPDWTRDPVIGDLCTICQDLNNYVRNPDQQIGRFSMTSAKRQHIEKMLQWSGSTYVMETEKRGSPHTLVVRKPENQLRRECPKWQKRREQATKLIQSLGSHVLEQCLGSGRDELVSMKALLREALGGANPNRDHVGALRTKPSAGSITAPQAVVPQKRKLINVIDLESD